MWLVGGQGTECYRIVLLLTSASFLFPLSVVAGRFTVCIASKVCVRGHFKNTQKRKVCFGANIFFLKPTYARYLQKVHGKCALWKKLHIP